MLNFRSANESGTAYSNRTLVNNWYEDRFAGDKKLNTTERVFSRDLSATADKLEATSTKSSTDTQMLTALAATPSPRPKPELFGGESAAKAALGTYLPGGTPPAKLAYTLGRTVVQDQAEAHNRHLETTNQVFYQKRPAQDKAAHPEVFDVPQDRSKFFTATLRHELRTQPHVTVTDPNPPGAKGCRGEITRNPKESGNPYGVSVFVDEYATWGTALKGRPLTETVNRKMTAYWP